MARLNWKTGFLRLRIVFYALFAIGIAIAAIDSSPSRDSIGRTCAFDARLKMSAINGTYITSDSVPYSGRDLCELVASGASPWSHPEVVSIAKAHIEKMGSLSLAGAIALNAAQHIGGLLLALAIMEALARALVWALSGFSTPSKEHPQ